MLLLDRGFYLKMIEDNLLQKVKEAGFETIDDFVKANVHYLSKEKQKLFCSIIDFEKACYQEKDSKKLYYQSVNYNGNTTF